MQWRCRQEIEDVLWAAARAQLAANALDRKRLLRAISERSALYTSEREDLQDNVGRVQPASDLAARALFFSVADAAKIGVPLAELAGRGCLPEGARWRVLDLGAGAGAMGLGILSFCADRHPGITLDIDAVDLDEAALNIYADAVARLASTGLELGASRVTPRCQSACTMSIESSSYDLVVLGSVLNELREAEAIELTKRAMQGLRPGGSLIVIEPALRETSRGLHRVRDALIGAGHAIFAPCTRQNAPCPALADERDWCHEDRPGVLPSRARQMAQSTGLRDGGLKFSYLVVRQDDEGLVDAAERALAFRVVSQPQRSKGQRTCFACGQPGRLRVRLLKRNRNGGNRDFEHARRGDLLLTEAVDWQAGELCDIDKGQTVERRQPANDDD